MTNTDPITCSAKELAALREDLNDLRENLAEVNPLLEGFVVSLAKAQPLMRFYGVDSLADLIEAQNRHVERLQAKLPRNTSDDKPQMVRA